LYETIVHQSDLQAARVQWRFLAPLMRLVFREHLGGGNDPQWLSVMKAAVNMIGPSVGEPQLPIQPLDGFTREMLTRILRDLGYVTHD
jgi:dihydrodipicolinate synthase/N-acetylneuraminate lyase